MIGHVSHGQCFARVNPHGSGVNSGGGLLNVAGKALVNHPAEGNPVIRPNADGDENEKNSGPKKTESPPGSPETPANSNSQDDSPFRREQNRAAPAPRSHPIPLYRTLYKSSSVTPAYIPVQPIPRYESVHRPTTYYWMRALTIPQQVYLRPLRPGRAQRRACRDPSLEQRSIVRRGVEIQRPLINLQVNGY